MESEVKSGGAFRFVLNVCCVFILLFVALLVLSFFSHPQVVFELAFRLLFGFYWFLRENLPRISANMDVVVPGVLAFLLAAGMIHWFGRSWFVKRGRVWSAGLTVCVASLLPILFVTAFLVPGILLQLRFLMTEDRIMHRGASERAFTIMSVRNHAQAIQAIMQEEKRDRYPESLKSEYLSSAGSDLIYPASGMPATLDGSFPLIISPAYRDRSQKLRRWVVRVDGEMEEIPAEDLEVWLEKAWAVRKETVSRDRDGK